MGVPGFLRSLTTCTTAVAVIGAAVFSVAAQSIPNKPIWLAVGPPGLVESLEPLAQKRRQDGFQVTVSTQSIERALSALPRRPDFLLLVGDHEDGAQQKPWYLPSQQRALYRWRGVQREHFATDALWGDQNGDLVPETAVGRIPARTGDQVSVVVKKILDFEQQKPGVQDLRILVWIGSPGYGPAFDAIATGFFLSQMHATVPQWASPWLMSSDPNHVLCGWPADQATIFTRQMRRGGICHVLAGHATEAAFFSMKHEDRAIWYTANDARRQLTDGTPTPPLVFFTCNSGNFAGQDLCMAESFLLLPGGPVATIGATTESHPLTNYFTGKSFLLAAQRGDDRLGTVWFNAQRSALKARNPIVEAILRDVEGKLEDELDVSKLRRDQMLMYALLGDPATRLRIPKPLKVDVRPAESGWRWTVQRPAGGIALTVGFRPAEPKVMKRTTLTDRKTALAALEEANSQLAFQPVKSLDENAAWTGTHADEGLLRFVATGPGGIFVAVTKVTKQPTHGPARGAR
jgi:hypothetical protein